VHLNAVAASRLATVVNQLSLAPFEGIVHCPADFYGATTIIAFSYRTGRTVDLLFHTAGCMSLSNGYVTAEGVSHPDFYDGFESTFASLAPVPDFMPGD